MGRFNPNDYATVEERLTEFWNAHPDGRVATDLVRLDPPMVVFRAEVFRGPLDPHPAAVGYAYEKEGDGMVNKTSYIENCETSAVGRALANLGLHGKKGAPRPSREEMEKVQRMSAHNEKVTEQIGELLAKIKPEHVSAMTDRDSNALYGLKEAVRTGDVGLLERGLPWLNKLVQGLDALDKLEGAA